MAAKRWYAASPSDRPWHCPGWRPARGLLSPLRPVRCESSKAGRRRQSMARCEDHACMPPRPWARRDSPASACCCHGRWLWQIYPYLALAGAKCQRPLCTLAACATNATVPDMPAGLIVPFSIVSLLPILLYHCAGQSAPLPRHTTLLPRCPARPGPSARTHAQAHIVLAYPALTGRPRQGCSALLSSFSALRCAALLSARTARWTRWGCCCSGSPRSLW